MYFRYCHKKEGDNGDQLNTPLNAGKGHDIIRGCGCDLDLADNALFCFSALDSREEAASFGQGSELRTYAYVGSNRCSCN